MHINNLKTILLSFSILAVAACADGTAGDSSLDGFVEMTSADLAVAYVDDGTGAMVPLVVADDATAYLAVDQDVHAPAPEPATTANVPCAHTIATYENAWVPHSGLICTVTGGCFPSTYYMQELVTFDKYCSGAESCRAHHANGTTHATTRPNQEETSFCEYPCNPHNDCAGCIRHD